MTCQECQELLPLYLTGSLEPAELMAVRAHLATGCAECAAELAALETTFHKIPAGLPAQGAPESAWEKLQTRIALKEQAEPASAPDRTALAAPFEKRRSDWLPWAAAAAVAIFMGIGWMMSVRRNTANELEIARLNNVLNKAGDLAFKVADMQDKLAELQARINKLAKDGDTQMALNVKLSQELRDRMDTLAQAEQYPVTSPEQPTANGKLYWNKKSKSWQIFLTGVKPAEAGKTYELWIVTSDHKLAAGTANVDDQGRLYFEAKTLPDTPLLAAAITDEQAKGEPDDGAKGKVQFLAKLPTP